ncbi:hypothetical protein BGZ70_009450 [Mortierella alpina]|uniref:Zn(2)-C6 fungal-type domain-containing protein n=1 Tax=Mortierella alpina TaxID=64518 RepID=A0A9P6JDG1_MORAP|nr:hypothetical protein BGZ70_009450 [Mortierella alpina]
MQVFEFQADSTVTLASTAAINRKSCDHCFLNRKTCDKVRTATDSGDKCKRCAKDSRPCTFTPTVHLYHIADCVGRHQCRAKVIQAMGGRKKEVKFKTIEIPIVCDMDSELDQALYEYIQKQPNLLVYNNRIKSFLAQDMLGLTEEQEDLMSTQNDQGVPDSTGSSESPSHGSKRSFEVDELPSTDFAVNSSLASPTQGPHKYRIMALIDAHQSQSHQHQQQHQQQQQQHQQHQLQQQQQHYTHQRNVSQDQNNYVPNSSKSPRVTPLDAMQLGGMPSSPNSLSPSDALNLHQRRQSENFAAAMLPSISPMDQLGGLLQHQNQQQPQQQVQHPYAQQSPYPQANLYQQQQHQQFQPLPQLQTGYRSTSPMPPSPLQASPTRHSPQPPSPLELSLNINTNFGTLNNSQQNLPSLFDSSLTMSTQQHHLQQEQQHQTKAARTSVATSTSPQMGFSPSVSDPVPPPLVITTTNEDGNEVGFYYAVPSVNLNPAYNDADLFQDFTMMDALGEDFVWIENLFDEPTPEEAAANMAAMSVAAAAGQAGSTSADAPGLANGLPLTAGNIGNAECSSSVDIAHNGGPAFGMTNSVNDVAMGAEQIQDLAASSLQQQQQQQQQQQAWMNQNYSQSMQG